MGATSVKEDFLDTIKEARKKLQDPHLELTKQEKEQLTKWLALMEKF